MDLTQSDISEIKEVCTYNFEKKLYLDKMSECKGNNTNSLEIQSVIEMNFFPICEWPSYILHIIMSDEFNNINRLILALFFKFNICSYELTKKIIKFYNDGIISDETDYKLSYLWHKTLDLNKNDKIRGTYFYYDLSKKMMLHLNGEKGQTKIIIIQSN